MLDSYVLTVRNKADHAIVLRNNFRSTRSWHNDGWYKWSRPREIKESSAPHTSLDQASNKTLEIVNELTGTMALKKANAGLHPIFRRVSNSVISSPPDLSHCPRGSLGYCIGRFKLADGARSFDVQTTREGRVIYAGSYGGYRKVLLVSYSSGLRVAYAGVSCIKVTSGQLFHKAQTLASFRNTGTINGSLSVFVANSQFANAPYL